VPLVASYLGIVIIWYEKGEIYWAILKFAKYVPSYSFLHHHMITNHYIFWRLTEMYDGVYLAQVLVACIKWYGLEYLVSFYIHTPNFLLQFDCAATGSCTLHRQCQ
jgi:hypothetical protein